jgi:phage terminase small subunit
VTSTALTSRQSRFVQAYCLHLNASRAAREAGYSSSSGADAVTGHKLLRFHKTKMAIQALQAAKAAEMELDRAAIIRAVLGAIEMAKELGKPASCISGWMTVARLTGLDKPDPAENRRNMPLSPGAQRVKSRIEAMSTNELLELVAAKEEAAE